MISRLCILFALLCFLSLSSCKHPDEEPEADASEAIEPVGLDKATLVLVTDSDEWRVYVFKEHLLYSQAKAIELPSPWQLPTRNEAATLRLLDYPHEERFITSDGYTFGMPSSSVSKAGTKTKYSVLGLSRRCIIIDVPF